MCGRYALYGPHSQLREYFGTANDLDLAPRFNIAPSQMVPIVRLSPEGQRVILLAKWGLIPSWVKDPAELNQPINAKAETAAIKPLFRHAFRKSRVLVPADAFFEWKLVAGKKQPYLIRMRDESPFGMAGLLEHWQAPEGELLTFAILTTEPNPLMAEIHNRMPVIIRSQDYELWLDPRFSDVETLQVIAGPYPERLMEAYPVSRRVNRATEDDADMIEPLA